MRVKHRRATPGARERAPTTRRGALVFAFLAVISASAPGQAASATAAPVLRVMVDSVARRVILIAGPFDIPAAMPGMEGMEHSMHHEHAHADLLRLSWPVDGYLTGTAMDVRDASGKPIPSALVHHTNMTNFDRRQLIYPEFEVLFAMGQGTTSIQLPRGVGVPLPMGEHLGLSIVWHNETGVLVSGAMLRLTMSYALKRDIRVAVLPFYVDVSNVAGGANSFDIPAGRSRQEYRFTLPVSGRLIAVGGHLHDHGVSLRLADVRSGKVLVKLKALHDSAGHVPATTSFVFGFHEDALKLEADRQYRMVSDYDNRTGATIVDGATAHFLGIFEPQDISRLPPLDPSDSDFQKDLARFPLEVRALAEAPRGGAPR